MFDVKILERIIQAWAADQDHPDRNREQKLLPDVSDVRILIETAFLASLKQEEKQPVKFAIALMSKADNPAEEAEHEQVILRFRHSLPLNPETIAKLASAFDPRITSLIAAPAGQDKIEYEIWGAMFFGPTTDRFEKMPATVSDPDLSRPDVFMVTAITAGSLLITRGNSQIGRFASGEFVPAIPSPFSSKAMGLYIMNMIESDEEFETHNSHYRDLYPDILDRLLSEVSVRGHGGTIIIIPEQKIPQYRNEFTSNYTFEKSLGLDTILSRIPVSSLHYETPIDRENQLRILTLNKKYIERINVVAQLACIDGALMLSSRLRVICFGSKLIARQWDHEVRVGPDAFGGGGDVFNTSRLGTRHNSAINFVGACDGSIAFVISQDGPIRGFVRKDSRTILCWPDCRVSMFV